MRTRVGLLLFTATLLLGTGACSSSTGGQPTTHPATGSPAPPTPSTSGPGTTTPPPEPSSPTTASTAQSSTSSHPAPVQRAQRVLRGMSLTERIGQLFMVDCPSTGVHDATITAITDEHVGAVILDGTTRAGSGRITAVTDQLQSHAPRGAGLLIATDQEGGQVQRLQGPGFDRIPGGLAQGELAPSALRKDAARWARQLRAAGVNVNLAPVLDTVPADSGANPPIGGLGREYGHDPAAVTSHGLAFLRGMRDAGVAAVAKHFPGLGRVGANTDLSAGVRDTVTTRHDPYLAPFAAAVKAGVPFVMMSTAIYERIDAGTPAAFSHTIVTGMLRHGLGFRGVVISDDLGAAKQVAGYSPGQRAVQFIAAGGDMVLTVDPGVVAAMTSAVLQRARSSTAFRAQVNAAALRVLRAKDGLGLLG